MLQLVQSDRIHESSSWKWEVSASVLADTMSYTCVQAGLCPKKCETISKIDGWRVLEWGQSLHWGAQLKPISAHLLLSAAAEVGVDDRRRAASSPLMSHLWGCQTHKMWVIMATSRRLLNGVVKWPMVDHKWPWCCLNRHPFCKLWHTSHHVSPSSHLLYLSQISHIVCNLAAELYISR